MNCVFKHLEIVLFTMIRLLIKETVTLCLHVMIEYNATRVNPFLEQATIFKCCFYPPSSWDNHGAVLCIGKRHGLGFSYRRSISTAH